MKMNISPEISVIIPTYNRCQYLEELLDCLMLQKTEEVEILVSNNASIDDTDEMIAKRRFDIRYFHQKENVGGVLNTIYLVRHVKSKYVLFLADSELIVEDGIEYLLNTIKQNPEIGVIITECSSFEVDDHGDRNITPLVYNYYNEDRLFREGGEALELVFKMTSNISGILIRTDLLDLEGFKRHYNSRYPQLYLAGKAVIQSDAYHISYPIVLLREGIAKYWKHQEAFKGQEGFVIKDDDFNCRSILGIAKDLTKGLENGFEIYRRLAKFRVRNVFCPLLNARNESFSSFLNSTKAIAHIPDYRFRWEFWFWVITIGILGERNFLHIGKIMKMLFLKNNIVNTQLFMAGMKR